MKIIYNSSIKHIFCNMKYPVTYTETEQKLIQLEDKAKLMFFLLLFKKELKY